MFFKPGAIKEINIAATNRKCLNEENNVKHFTLKTFKIIYQNVENDINQGPHQQNFLDTESDMTQIMSELTEKLSKHKKLSRGTELTVASLIEQAMFDLSGLDEKKVHTKQNNYLIVN